MRREQGKRAVVAMMTVRRTKMSRTRDIQHSFARPWLLGVIWGSAVLVLVGASYLFSLLHQTDGQICAILAVSLLLTTGLLLARTLVSHTSSARHETEEG